MIHPKIRLICAVISSVGILLCSNIFILLGIFICILLPLTIYTKTIKAFISFFLKVFWPILIALIITWGFIIQQNPNSNSPASAIEGVKYSLFISLRLLILIGIFQVAFLSISKDTLINQLRTMGFRQDYLLVMVGAYAIWPDMKKRSTQIIEARMARGLIPKMSLYYRIFQIKHILRPLVISTIHNAIVRAEVWSERDIINTVLAHGQNKIKYNITLNVILSSASCIILFIGMVY